MTGGIVCRAATPFRVVDTLTVAEGSTLSEIAAAAFPMAQPCHLRVAVGDMVVPPEVWHLTRPRAGHPVVVRLVPTDNDVMRTVLMVTVVVAALAISAGALGPAGLAIGGELFAAGSTSAQLLSGGVLIAGNLLINELVPTSQRDEGTSSPSAALQGWRNVAQPNGVIPCVLGRHRMAPVYAARPYTQSDGYSQSVVALFLLGHGPVDISDIRIADTPIEQITSLAYETRQGFGSEPPISLYPRQVIEDSLKINLTNQVGAQVRTSAEATLIECEIMFPGGLFRVDERGRRKATEVDISLRYRRVGEVSWTTGGNQKFFDSNEKTIWRPIVISVPLGRYDIELTRTTADHKSSDQISSKTVWTVMRSIRAEHPIAAGTPLGLIAAAGNVSDQLGGQIAELNCMVASIIPDWDSATGTWISRTTSNPASLFRWVLQGPPAAFPLADDEIDIVGLQEWHEFCADKGLEYNKIHDGSMSMLDVLRDVAAAGRATPHDTGDKWSVVVDRTKSVVTGHISPRNSWNFSGERPYVELPDAFRVQFRDETNGYKNAEMVIPFPGVELADVEVTEALSLPGVTHPTQVWRTARWRQYQLIHRRDTWTVSQDFEALANTRGDLVMLSHDVLDRTMLTARVVGVDGDRCQIDNPVVMDAASSYAARFRLSDGTSIFRGLETIAGESNIIKLSGGAGVPAAGDLAFIGPSSRVSFEAVIKDIEISENLVHRITLVDHAPIIEQLTDTESPPPWLGQAGIIVALSDEPAVPVILQIVSGQLAADPGDSLVVVSVGPGIGSRPIDHYELDHRLVGDPLFTTIVGAAGETTLEIDSVYAFGDTIEVRVRAIGSGGTASPYTEIVEHAVAADDIIVPSLSSFSGVRLGGGEYRYTWAVSTPTPPPAVATVVGIKAAYGRGRLTLWSELTAIGPTLATSPTDVGAPVFEESYTFGGRAVSDFGELGAETIVTPALVNLLTGSDNPGTWPIWAQAGVTLGSAVADPGAGSGVARPLTFTATNSYYYGNYSLPSGNTNGRTFTASVWLRAPAGKAQIGLVINDSISLGSLIVNLTSSWQRFSVSHTYASSGTRVALGLENRAGVVAGLNDAAGDVEVWGGMISETTSIQTYQRIA